MGVLRPIYQHGVFENVGKLWYPHYGQSGSGRLLRPCFLNEPSAAEAIAASVPWSIYKIAFSTLQSAFLGWRTDSQSRV